MNIRKNIAISENGFIFNPLTGESHETIMKALQDEFELDANSAEIDLNDFLSMLKSYQRTEYEDA